MKRSSVVLALVPLLIIAACTPAEEEAAEQDLDTLQTEITGEMQEWRMEMDSSLARLEGGIDSLEAQAEEAGAEAEPEINSTIAELREQLDSLQQDLNQLETASEATYEDIRADIERELEELETDLQAARERFGDEDEGATSS